MYLEKGGFQDFKGYILISLSGFGVVGSFVLGLMYEKISNVLCRSLVFILTQSIVVICLFLMTQLLLDVENKWGFVLLISIIGFCIVGTFNSLITIEVMLIS